MRSNNPFLQEMVLLRNDPELIEVIQAEAYKGNIDAQYALGLVYAEGRGTAEDLVKAHAWLSVAVMQGDSDAEVLRNIVAGNMELDQFEPAAALASRLIGQIETLPKGSDSLH